MDGVSYVLCALGAFVVMGALVWPIPVHRSDAGASRSSEGIGAHLVRWVG